jgi:hypothetical protein
MRLGKPGRQFLTKYFPDYLPADPVNMPSAVASAAVVEELITQRSRKSYKEVSEDEDESERVERRGRKRRVRRNIRSHNLAFIYKIFYSNIYQTMWGC